MNNKWVRWGACLIVPLFFLIFKLPVIQLDFGQEVYFLKDKTFHLKWIHSVEKEEWVEVYERDRDELVLTETFFKTFGAGVPSGGEIMESEDGYVHMKIGRRLPEINLTVSENAQTTIETKEKTIPLYELTEDYRSIKLSIKYIHLWEYVGGTHL